MPELFERLRRLTHRRDGGRLVGIMTPDLARAGYPCARHMGKAGAVAAYERVCLSSVGVMRPFFGRLRRARARPVLSHMSQRAGASSTERRVRMARPIFTSSLGPLGGQRRQRSGGDKMCWTRRHVGSLLVGKKLYA